MITLRVVFAVGMLAYCWAKGNVFLGIINAIVICNPTELCFNP